MQVGGGQKNVQARGGRRFESFDRCVDVVFSCAGESSDGNSAYFLGDLADGLEVAARGDRETGFNDIDAENGKLPREADLLGRVHGKTRRLLAVAKRSVEDAYDV